MGFQAGLCAHATLISDYFLGRTVAEQVGRHPGDCKAGSWAEGRHGASQGGQQTAKGLDITSTPCA